MKIGITVYDSMTRKPVMVGPDENLQKCAKIMLKQKVGSLIVKESGKLKGIVTEKDFIDKIVSKGIDPKKTKVKDIMSTIVFTVEPNKDLFEAIKIMAKEETRRLPVIDNDGKLVGLLTMKDVLRIQPQLFDLMVEKFNIREERRKPTRAKYKKGLEGLNSEGIDRREGTIEGNCESCDEYGELTNVGGQNLCSLCKKG